MLVENGELLLLTVGVSLAGCDHVGDGAAGPEVELWT